MRRIASLLVVLACVAALPAAAADPGSPDAEAPAELGAADLDAFLGAAERLHHALDEIRRLPLTPANAARLERLHLEVQGHYADLLEAAGMTPEEFVRLLDRGSIHRGDDEVEPPVHRALRAPAQ